MTSNNEAVPVEVFEGTSWEAALVKSLLENAEIETFFKDEIRGNIMPWQVSPGGFNSVKIVVSSTDYERAIQVVDEFRANQQRDDEPETRNHK
jgi:hypothetical protein